MKPNISRVFVRMLGFALAQPNLRFLGVSGVVSVNQVTVIAIDFFGIVNGRMRIAAVLFLKTGIRFDRNFTYYRGCFSIDFTAAAKSGTISSG
jgi:hypothetical protein